jgi:hypothetical protein
VNFNISIRPTCCSQLNAENCVRSDSGSPVKSDGVRCDCLSSRGREKLIHFAPFMAFCNQISFLSRACGVRFSDFTQCSERVPPLLTLKAEGSRAASSSPHVGCAFYISQIMIFVTFVCPGKSQIRVNLFRFLPLSGSSYKHVRRVFGSSPVRISATRREFHPVLIENGGIMPQR